MRTIHDSQNSDDRVKKKVKLTAQNSPTQSEQSPRVPDVSSVNGMRPANAAIGEAPSVPWTAGVVSSTSAVHPFTSTEPLIPVDTFNLNPENSMDFATLFSTFDPNLGDLPSPLLGSWNQPVELHADHTERGESSEEVPKGVLKVWPRRRAIPVMQRIHSLWSDAVAWPSDNIFVASTKDPAEPEGIPIRPRWGMDAYCRERLIDGCNRLLLPAETYSGPITVPGTPVISSLPDTETIVEGLSPQAPELSFPSVETLSLSMDLYFRRFHPNLPFIHQATFDARTVPVPLVLAICLIGLTTIRSRGTSDFVAQFAAKLLRFCRLDLTYKALGKGGAHQFLSCLATSVLVLYLGLHSQVKLDENQAHMLAIQTLFIADRHGLFRSFGGAGRLSDAFCESGIGTHSSWTKWSKLESVKRLVLCLISIDSAYTRTLDVAAHIGLTSVKVILPCSSTLFESSDVVEFLKHVRTTTAPVTMQQVDLATISALLIRDLDNFTIRVLLDLLSLKEAATRHQVSSSSVVDAASINFVPALLYTADGREGSIAGTLYSIALCWGNGSHRRCPTNELLWHFLCLTQTVDIDRVQNACGRAGRQRMSQALAELQKWAVTPAARRSLVHCAQIFRISSNFRLENDKTLILDLIISAASMVMAIYAFVTPQNTSPTVPVPFELLQDINPAVLGNLGLSIPFSDDSITEEGQTVPSAFSPCSATQFLEEGGNAIFAGAAVLGSEQSARKLLLNYAQLLDELSSGKASEYSQLLLSISDLLVAPNHDT